MSKATLIGKVDLVTYQKKFQVEIDFTENSDNQLKMLIEKLRTLGVDCNLGNWLSDIADIIERK